MPKDARTAFDIRPHKNKLRNKPRGFPGSTGPPGFCNTQITNNNAKFYIAESKTPLDNILSRLSNIIENYFSTGPTNLKY